MLLCAVNVEEGADAYAALQKGFELKDLTPLSEGTAQWWSDGLTAPQVYIHHAKLSQLRKQLGCTFASSSAAAAAAPASSSSNSSSNSSSSSSSGGKKKEMVSAAGAAGAKAAEEAEGEAAEAAAAAASIPASLCVLRIDIEAPTAQPYRLLLEGSSNSYSFAVNLLSSGVPYRGVLQGRSSDYFKLDIHPKLLEDDADASIRILLEAQSFTSSSSSSNSSNSSSSSSSSSSSGGPSLTVVWPDGFSRVFRFPNSRKVIIKRKERDWTQGYFLFLVRQTTTQAAAAAAAAADRKSVV